MKSVLKIVIVVIVLLAVAVGYKWGEKTGFFEGILFPDFEIVNTEVDWEMEGVSSVVYEVKSEVKNKSGFPGRRVVTCTFADSDGEEHQKEKELRIEGEKTGKVIFEFSSSLGKEAVKRLTSKKDFDSRYQTGLKPGKPLTGVLDRIKGIADTDS
ncbi:MAG: hypothetical protein R6V10_03110 [bacterium]